MPTTHSVTTIDNAKSDADHRNLVPALQTPECDESASTREDVTALSQERDCERVSGHGNEDQPDQSTEQAPAQDCGEPDPAEGPIDVAPLVDLTDDGQMPSGPQTDIQHPVDDVTALPADPAPTEADASVPGLPDPSSLTSRLRNLVERRG